MDWIIFSKNRSYQLDALLKSAYLNAQIKPEQIKILYKYDKEFQSSFEILKKEHNNICFYEETNFKQQLIDILKSSSNIISFGTDDALFTRKINVDSVNEMLKFNNILSYSCRLGLNINYCYPLKSIQKIPNGQIINNTFIFDWTQSTMDWNYPFSVDGHFFKKDFIIKFLENLKFYNPNSLESMMSINSHIFKNINFLSCDLTSSYFNNPINVVQHEFKNRHGNISADFLNEMYLSGNRFNVEKISNFFNQSPHEEVDYLK